MNRRKCFLTDAEVLGHLSDRHAGNRDRLFEAIRFIKFGDHPRDICGGHNTY